MQAVALPEAKEVTEDPGKLPQPDKVTKAYFEASLLSPNQKPECVTVNSKASPPQGRLTATI